MSMTRVRHENDDSARISNNGICFDTCVQEDSSLYPATLVLEDLQPRIWAPYIPTGVQAGNTWGGPPLFSPKLIKGSGGYINKSSAYPPGHFSHLTEAPRASIDFGRVAKIARLEKAAIIPSEKEYSHGKSNIDFYYRDVGENDMMVLRDLHSELFPVAYQEPFYVSIRNKEIPTTIICWAANKSSPQGGSNDSTVEESTAENPIVAFACRSPEFPLDETAAHPVGVQVARRELTTLIRHIAYKQALVDIGRDSEAPVNETFLDELLATVDDKKFVSDELLNLLVGKTEYLLTLGVMQEFRRKGLASALISHLQRDSIRRGKKVMMLHVVDYNTSALDMYIRNGFEVLDHYVNYYSFLDQLHDSYLAVWVAPSNCQELDLAVLCLTTELTSAYRQVIPANTKLF